MKKAIALLLSLSLLLSCLAFHATATSNDEAAPIKVLTIGNSYTVDSMPLINKIALAHGEDPMVLGWLYYPGCTLSLHYNYGSNNETKYTYYKNTTGATTKTANSTLLDGLQDEDWDIIFLQQAPCESGMPNKFDPSLDNLITFVNEHKTNPDAKFGWHLTWAYQKAYQTLGKTYSKDFVTLFNGDPYTMYQAIVSTAQDKVLSRQIGEEGAKVDEFVKMAPSGTAIENARTSYFGDNLQRDSYHLNQWGKIITAYTWYATLTNKTALTSIELSNDDAGLTLSEADRAVILESVNNALAAPFERTLSQYTTRPDEDVYFVMSTPKTGGGTLSAYHQADPTTRVEVTYTSSANQVSSKTFYKLENGVLTGLRIASAKVAAVGYHNHFKNYDAATQTLYLSDCYNTESKTKTCTCSFTCYSNPDGGNLEVPHTIYNVPATTTVVDVTGTDHGISTLQDVIDLSGQYRIRLSHYAPDAGAPAAFYVDELTELEYPRYTMQEGDIFFCPEAVKAGELAEGYIIKSATKAAGSKVTVTIPSGTSGADGYNGTSRGRFWVMEGEKLALAKGVWETATNAKAYKFTYHDTITSYTPATADTTGSLSIAHAPGHTSNQENCGWKFENACGQAKAADRYRETYHTLKVSNAPTIIDLTGNNCTTLQKVKSLTDAKNAVINVYADDGTKSAGTASVVVVLDPSPDFVPNPPITYTITVADDITGGTVSVDKTEGIFDDIVTVTASPAGGYELESILVDGVAITGNTFPITGNHIVTATFTFDLPIDYDTTYTITVADDVVDGTVTVDKTTPYGNERVSITATPADGYVLKSVQVNGKDISGTTFTASENAEVTAVFAKVVKPGDVMYFPGDPVGLEYVEGYLVSSDTPERKIFFYFKGGFSGK